MKAPIIPNIPSCAILLTPRHEGLAENLLVPYLEALLLSKPQGYGGIPSAVRGQCLLVLREAYEFIGGHATISNYVADDLHLAMLASRHKMGIGVVRASTLGHARTYSGWEGGWKWIERKAFRLFHMDARITVRTLLMASIAALWLPLAVWLWLDGHRVIPFLVVLLVLLALRPWYGNRMRLLLAPVAIYAALPFLFHGLTTAFFKKEIVWKGRKVTAA